MPGRVYKASDPSLAELFTVNLFILVGERKIPRHQLKQFRKSLLLKTWVDRRLERFAGKTFLSCPFVRPGLSNLTTLCQESIFQRFQEIET